MAAMRVPGKGGELAELDELALLRAQRGEADACRALVERYQRPVFALLARLLGPRAAASVEDLAQETFLKAFRALPGFDRSGPARLSTWLLTIASRLAIDELRRQGAPAEPIDEQLPDECALGSFDRAGLRRALNKAAAELSPEQRAAFLLREAHGLSYEEIAVALGLELGTVRSRLSRARAALRMALEGEHG